jgi:hypothetical protein
MPVVGEVIVPLPGLGVFPAEYLFGGTMRLGDFKLVAFAVCSGVCLEFFGEFVRF